LRRAQEAGIPLAGIRSVASFFVSRVDTEADARLAALHRPEADALRGRVAVANTRLAYADWEASLADPAWRGLAAAGAHAQRPLWASLGVKDPAMRDTRYVEDLVAPEVIDTMPLGTLEAVADHAVIAGDTIRGGIDEAEEVLSALEQLGVSLPAIAAGLERTGIADFGSSWEALVDAVTVRGADALR
jgi:transaldolase